MTSTNPVVKPKAVSISNQTVIYPTDPLTSDEVDYICNLIKTSSSISNLFNPVDVANTAVFLEVLLKEPKKSHVVAFEQDSSLPLGRQARVIVYNNVNNDTYVIILSLREPSDNVNPIAVIDSTKLVEKDMYPNNNYDNYPVDDNFGGNQYYGYFPRSQLIDIVRSDANLMRKLLKYNVTDAMLDPANSANPDYIYPYAFYPFESFRQLTGIDIHADDIIPAHAKNHRYMPVGFFNQKTIPGDIIVETANWGFVNGIFFIVDCNAKSIFKIVQNKSLRPKHDNDPPIPLAVSDPYPAIYHPEMKPIQTCMPDGVSFIVDDVNDTHKVNWDNWEFHWSYQRSGLTLYNIYYTETVGENSAKRKILYKLCASDTLVIYNSTQPLIEQNYVSADSHNWPILQRLQTLVPGRDVPGYARLYPIVTMDAGGNSRVIPDAVAIYEQETDLAWRVNQGVIDFNGWPNLEFNTNYGDFLQLTGCRKRELVIRTLFSGFYYLFMYSFVFSQDGSIECFCDLMGQTTNQWIAYEPSGEVKDEAYRGSIIAKQMLGLNHTHSVIFRMDFDIDYFNPNGSGNSISEQNASVVKSKKINPAGQVVEYTEEVLKRENEASRNQSIKKNRTWTVFNPNSLNRLNKPRGYEIWSVGPNGNSTSLARDDSQAHLHLSYLKHHLHVTKYHDNEQFASGEFPVLTNKPSGIAKYIEDKEHIEDTDIVVWFNRMFAHTPATEDYPFISTHRMGVSLNPENFFGMNPICSLEQVTDVTTECDTGEPALFTYNTV